MCVQKFQDDPQVVYCRAIAAKGTKVTSVEDGLPTWVAEVRFHASARPPPLVYVLLSVSM